MNNQDKHFVDHISRWRDESPDRYVKYLEGEVERLRAAITVHQQIVNENLCEDDYTADFDKALWDLLGESNYDNMG